MKRNIVITIARQYGSGGRTVGEKLANELGLHYYNKELIKLASRESGFTKGDMEIALDAFIKVSKKISSEVYYFSTVSL